ncbi:MAG: hypothetical protein LC104_08230 [Bacteroidales bacterium]|nr:hypothetical protein [Bacteroidales bacterium]
MTETFLKQFHQTAAGATVPAGLQILFAEPPELHADAVATVIRGYHPDLREATVELHRVAGTPLATTVVSGDGPPAAVIGLIRWGEHQLKLIAFAAPMPYGPVETCVGPGLLPPELKADARRHQAHVLLFHGGPHPDPLEQLVALAAVAGALSRFGGIVVLNEEARAAVPWYDLLPGDEEDGLATLRGLPIPYLWGGFVKMDVGDATRPWVRTFANHRLGLPNLAYHLTSHAETARIFQLFAGMLGYLKTMQETFSAGDVIDLGDSKVRLREPSDREWFLDSPGSLFVVEPIVAESEA